LALLNLAYLVVSCCFIVAAVVSFIVSSFTKKVDYYVPAAEVERIENERYALLEKHLKKD
jgi:cytochrome o ubiquinol oxidase subunit 1